MVGWRTKRDTRDPGIPTGPRRSPPSRENGLVETALFIKLLQRPGRCVLSKNHRGGTATHHIKEKKRDQDDPQNNGNHVENTAYDVTGH